jgi:hypothetical protein
MKLRNQSRGDKAVNMRIEELLSSNSLATGPGKYVIKFYVSIAAVSIAAADTFIHAPISNIL